MSGQLCHGGYRVTSGSPLNLRKPLRGDTYGSAINADLVSIDTRVTLNRILNDAQGSAVSAFDTLVTSRLQNLLGNGGFDVWSRGLVLSGGNTFTADLWKTAAGFLGTVSRGQYESFLLAGTDIHGPYSAVVESIVATSVSLYTRVFFVNNLVDSPLTFRASLLTSNADRFRLFLRSSVGETSTSSFATGSGTAETLSVSMVIPSGGAYIEAGISGTISVPGTHKVSITDAGLYLADIEDVAFVPAPGVLDLYRSLRHSFRPGLSVSLDGADNTDKLPGYARTLPLPHRMDPTPTLEVSSILLGTGTPTSSLSGASGALAIVTDGPSAGYTTSDQHLVVSGLTASADPF